MCTHYNKLRRSGLRRDFREINSDELPVIEKWIYQFCEDVNLPTTKEEAEQTAHTLITNHRLFGLEIDGKLVSVAAKHVQLK